MHNPDSENSAAYAAIRFSIRDLPAPRETINE